MVKQNHTHNKYAGAVCLKWYQKTHTACAPSLPQFVERKLKFTLFSLVLNNLFSSVWRWRIGTGHKSWLLSIVNFVNFFPPIIYLFCCIQIFCFARGVGEVTHSWARQAKTYISFVIILWFVKLSILLAIILISEHRVPLINNYFLKKSWIGHSWIGHSCITWSRF